MPPPPETLRDLYLRLLERYGPQHWWPAEEPFEVILGAILTQSAAWVNVSKAITNLKQAGCLQPSALRRLSREELARLIYPSGYYNAKAVKIRAFVEWLGEAYGDDLKRLFAMKTEQLRHELLSIHGIGFETADSILLYAAGKPIFVIDAYTRRILGRVGLTPPRADYTTLQALFMENLPPETQLFNEYHALLVRHGKETCRKAPLCQNCALRELCAYAKGK